MKCKYAISKRRILPDELKSFQVARRLGTRKVYTRILDLLYWRYEGDIPSLTISGFLTRPLNRSFVKTATFDIV